jgi:hypothetical protein
VAAGFRRECGFLENHRWRHPFDEQKDAFLVALRRFIDDIPRSE